MVYCPTMAVRVMLMVNLMITMMTTMVMMMMKMMISLDKPTILGIERAGQQEEKHSSPLLN